VQIAYAAIVSAAERFLVSKVSKHIRPKIHQQVATVNHLCLYMVDHVKCLMHLKLYGMLQHNHWWIDGWVPFAKYWGPGPQDWWTPYVATEHRHVDRIHYQWTSAVAGIVFQSLTVATIRGPRLKLLLWIFAWQNLDRTPATSQGKWHAQNFGRMSFGGPFPAGGPTHVRTVPNG